MKSRVTYSKPSITALEDTDARDTASPTIVVTGGTGFVGREVLPLLIKAGFNIRLVVRTLPADREPNSNLQIIRSPNLFAESHDWWSSVCGGANQVLHLAWIAAPGKYLDSEINSECLQGTVALAQGAIAAGVRHFTGIGTCLEYAPSSEPIPTSHPLQPKSVYAKCKVTAFESLSQFFAAAGVGFAWCRLFHMFGDHESPLRLGGYLRDCFLQDRVAELSDGRDVLDFSNVFDVAASLEKVVSYCVVGPLNICSGQAQTVRQFAENYAASRGKLHLLKFKEPSMNMATIQHLVGVPSALVTDLVANNSGDLKNEPS